MTKKNKGFALIELLTVMAVLAALAGILIPLVSYAAEEAKEATCLGNLKEIGAGVLLYEADWDGVIPYNGRGRTPDDNNWGLWLWEDRVALALGITPWNRQKTDYGTVFDCPDANPRLRVAYLSNYALTNWTWSDAPSPVFEQVRQPWRVSDIKRPEAVGFAVDGRENTTFTLETYVTDKRAYMGMGNVYDAARVDYRHDNKVNALYLDGHAGQKSEAQLNCL
ncbi:MAG: prepilin-type N-terminal cleavage/methylation domain-containing protein [Planctomycetota bacterium]